MTISPPPAGLWSGGYNQYVRAGGRFYGSASSGYTGPFQVIKVIPPIKDHLPSVTNPNELKIPKPIWNLAFKKPGGMDYVEGAMVHAQLLSRQGSARGKSYDNTDPAAIATMKYLGATMRAIRTRIWSIPVSEATQYRAFQLILALQQKLPTETAKAAFLYDVFDNKLSVTDLKDLPEGLSRLPNVTDKLAKAMTWVEYVLQLVSGKESREVNYFNLYKSMEQKVTPGMLISLGVESKQIERAVSIGRGFDLIVVASMAKWVRELQRGIYESQPHWLEDWTYEHTNALTNLTQMTTLYGVEEIDDASLRKANEGYLATAISRLTSYKKGLQKRLAKAQDPQ